MKLYLSFDKSNYSLTDESTNQSGDEILETRKCELSKHDRTFSRNCFRRRCDEGKIESPDGKLIALVNSGRANGNNTEPLSRPDTITRNSYYYITVYRCNLALRFCRRTRATGTIPDYCLQCRLCMQRPVCVVLNHVGIQQELRRLLRGCTRMSRTVILDRVKSPPTAEPWKSLAESVSMQRDRQKPIRRSIAAVLETRNIMNRILLN